MPAPKTPPLPKPIMLNNWEAGISGNPYQGFSDMRNVEISLVPGIVFPTYASTKKTGTTITGQPMWAVEDSDSNATIYVLDDLGQVTSSIFGWPTWTAVGGNTCTISIANPAVITATAAHGLIANDVVVFATTSALPTGLVAGTRYYVIAAGLAANAFEVSTSQGGSAVITTGSQSGTQSFRVIGNSPSGPLPNNPAGQGLAIFKGYLFVARDTAIDVYGPLNSSPTWTNNWQTIKSDSLTHPMVAGQDDILYIGNGVDDTNRLGSTIISVQQKAAQIFAPTNAATYTYNATALQLPYPYRIRCLAELGANLMIGTFIGNDLNANYTKKIGDIFPWNRTAATFNLPIRLFEQGINSMLNVGNSLYISAGQTGNLYLFNGYQASMFFSFPSSSGASYTTPYIPIKFFPQSLMFHKNRIFFSISGAGSAGAGVSGVYSVSLQGQGLVMENSVSTLSTDNNLNVPVLLPLSDSNFKYLSGWKDITNAAQGVDIVGADNANTNFTSFIDSPIYSVATVYQPRNFNTAEVYLDTPLVSGNQVRLQYRTDRLGSWTTLFTFDFATFGALQEYSFPIGVVSTREVQFRVLFSGATNPPRLKYINIT